MPDGKLSLVSQSWNVHSLMDKNDTKSCILITSNLQLEAEKTKAKDT